MLYIKTHLIMRFFCHGHPSTFRLMTILSYLEAGLPQIIHTKSMKLLMKCILKHIRFEEEGSNIYILKNMPPKAPFKVYRGPLTQHYHAKMCSNEFSYHWDKFLQITCLQSSNINKYTIYGPSRGPLGALKSP